MAKLPEGTVTFLFTDIEGSTRLAQRVGAAFAELIETHRRILREAFVEGVEISTEGDSLFVAFDDAVTAVRAAAAAQRALAVHPWPADAAVRVRMGIHTGHAVASDGNYVGLDVHRAARIAGAGHGGQVLLSGATHALVARDLPVDLAVRDLGEHRLKDLALPEHLYQLLGDGLVADFGPLTVIDERRTNLPLQLTSFIGRERQVAELTELLRSHRLATVIGTGGTGKTRLALEVAARLLSDHEDGAWLVELAPVTAPDLVVRELARSLGVQDESGRPIDETLLDFVRTKNLLLVMDNCEHLIDTVAALVANLAGAAPDLAVLSTSREALGVPGETVYQVPSMAVPPPLERVRDEHKSSDAWLPEVAGSEAVRLFVERAAAIAPGFSLTAENAGAVADICRRLDGIPLAIELASARVPLLSVSDIAQRLGDRFRLLTGGSRTALPRQQTLQALIDWSWDLLDEPDRERLRRLSAFVGGFTLDAATFVTDGADGDELDTLDAIGRLVDRSLVVADAGEATRYRLLETIRQYAGQRLLDADEASIVRERHAAFYRDLAERAAQHLYGPDMIAWLERLDADIENLRAAYDWAFDTDFESALRIGLGLAVYWRARGMVEGLDRLGRLADHLAAESAGVGRVPDSVALRARVLSAAANNAWMVGNAGRGQSWAERAVELARPMADAAVLADALDALALVHLFQGRTAGVTELADEARALATSSEVWPLVAFTEAGLAQWDAERGELSSAAGRLERATDAAARSQNPSLLAFTALSEARVAGFSGRLVEARSAFARAIAGYAALGDRQLELVARSDLGHALRMAGELEEAEGIYRKTLHDWLHAGNRGAIANQLESFALIAEARADWKRAAHLLAAAEALREVSSSPMLPYERDFYDAGVERVRAALGADEMRLAWEAGRRLTVDEATAMALDQEPM